MRIGIFYLVALAIACGVLFIWLREAPSESKMTFEESDEPGIEQLFIPIKLEIAEKLFEEPVPPEGLKLKTDKKNGRFIIKNASKDKKALSSVLNHVEMKAATVWDALKKIDSNVSLASDMTSLTLGIYEDEATGEEYVRVPAGLLRAYIE